MHVIGYTFDGGNHCACCAQAAWADKTLRYPRRLTHLSLRRDEHDIPMRTVGSDGDPVHAIFSTDEHILDIVCTDCDELIAAACTETA